jgi:hypothetical protein
LVSAIVLVGRTPLSIAATASTKSPSVSIRAPRILDEPRTLGVFEQFDARTTMCGTLPASDASFRHF